MSDKLFLEFPTLPAALLFLQKTCPSTVAGTWTRLKAFSLLRIPGREAVTLKMTGIPVQDSKMETAAQCGGKRVEKAGGPPGKTEEIPLESLFHRIQLEENRASEDGRHFLIIPERSNAFQVGQLIGQLSDLEGFSVWTREVLPGETGESRTVFELFSETPDEMPAPFGLEGAPQVLKAFDEDIFIPAGLASPLLPAYRFLFPPTNGEFFHSWFLGSRSGPEYVPIRLSGQPPIPLARGVILPESGRCADRKFGLTKNLQFPLHIRRYSSRRNLRRAAQVVYVIESRSGELGSPLLRLLDLAEARIDGIRYFNEILGEGPNAVVRHYLLMGAKLADDDLWPELKRFDLPRALDEVGIPLFIPGDCDFFPNLDGILAGLDAQDPFLVHLREVTGLAADAPRKQALVDLDSEGHWIITLLENGQPLESTISIVLERFHRQPVRRILDLSLVDLAGEHARYEQQWVESGHAEAEELGKLAQELVNQLGEAATSLEAKLKSLSEKMQTLTESSRQAQDLVSGAPARFTEFIERVVELVDSVAEPRKSWLVGMEQRQKALETLAADLETMQTEIEGTLERISSSFSLRRAGLLETKTRLQASCQALSAAEEEVLSLRKELETAAEEARRAIADREKSLDERRSEVEIRAGEIEKLRQIHDERERALKERLSELKKRLKEVKAREKQFQEEERTLRRIEEYELPASAEKIQLLEKKLETLKAKNLEENLNEARKKIESLQKAVDPLSTLQKELSQFYSRLSSLEKRFKAHKGAGEPSGPEEKGWAEIRDEAAGRQADSLLKRVRGWWKR